MQSILVIIFATLMAVGSPFLALVVQAPPKVGEVVLVVASPFSTPIEQVLQSSAMLDVLPDRAPVGAFVYLDSQQSYERLFENGALFVVSGERILALC